MCVNNVQIIKLQYRLLVWLYKIILTLSRMFFLFVINYGIKKVVSFYANCFLLLLKFNDIRVQGQ